MTGLRWLLLAACLCGEGAVAAQSRPAQTVAHRSPYPPEAGHAGPAWFVDVAPQAGTTVRNVNGSAEAKHYIIQSTGSGVAIIHYDRDGWPDIFLVNGQEMRPVDGASQKKTSLPTSHLFHNNHDGTFTDVTEQTGLRFTGWGQGACVGDYDNDGFDDLYVTAYGKNHLFHNEGGKRFREVSDPAG